MTEYDFKLMFGTLCANYGKNTNTDTMQIKGDLFFGKYAKVSTETFKKTIDLVMERHGATYGYFPAIKEISTCMSEVIKGGGGEKNYKYCPACNKNHSGVGAISMLITFNGDRSVAERHIWSFDLKRGLRREGKRAYDYNVCCRCEAGVDLFEARNGNTFQLTEKEYNKLLEGVHEVVKDRQGKLLQEEPIPF